MATAITLRDEAQEARLFRARVLVGLGCLFLCTALLIGRMVQLQIIQYDRFKTLSEDNRITVLPVAPTRGLIFDRNGIVVAQNTPTFTLEVIPEAVEDMDRLIHDLRDLVDISDEDVERFESHRRKKRSFESVPLRFRLNEDEVARFSVNRHNFPGVDVQARLTRNYPLGALAVHVIGYVGRINQRELQQLDPVNYRGTSHVGKTGVELSHEPHLHGTVGYQHVETNARGRTLRVVKRIAPRPGENLYLNIDIALQAAAERALGEETGAVVAMDPKTGAVLAMASMPGFDPNLFVDGIGTDDYEALLNSPDRPLFNRALHGQYPPGSTIKPVFALAGLHSGQFTSDKRVWCPGWFSLPGSSHRYRDWKRVGHGRVALKDAVGQSCDVYFYTLALELGIDKMHRFLRDFGFGQRTGIDLPAEADGLNPSREWKRRSRKQAWFPGETLISGIGQGYNLATPVQLASAAATLASRGVRLRPRVVARRVRTGGGQETVLPVTVESQISLTRPEYWDVAVASMVEVVHGRRGTARHVGADAGYTIAGKTGTAQVFTIGQDERYDAESLEKKLRDHALFIAFAPADEPRLAVAVLVENGGSGSKAAAPVARRVLDHYLRDVLDDFGDQPTLVTSAQARRSAANAPARMDGNESVDGEVGGRRASIQPSLQRAPVRLGTILRGADLAASPGHVTRSTAWTGGG